MLVSALLMFALLMILVCTIVYLRLELMAIKSVLDYHWILIKELNEQIYKD